MHAVLEDRAVLDQVQPPPRPLALGAQLRRGQQIAATRSRNDTSASTRASTWGEMPGRNATAVG